MGASFSCLSAYNTICLAGLLKACINLILEAELNLDIGDFCPFPLFIRGQI